MKKIETDLVKLSERCNEIDVKKDNNIVREITIELKETLREHKNGLGLSANQIGYNKRIFIINFKGDLRTFINPIITKTKGITINRESCLSIPNKEFILPRFNEIDVMYQTPLGITESKKFLGMAAYVFQHELDHLNGLNISDIGLEVDKSFDELSDEEKSKLVDEYMESLDLKFKQTNEEVQADPELKQMNSSIEFLTKLQKGEIEIERDSVDEETSKTITNKLKEIAKKED